VAGRLYRLPGLQDEIGRYLVGLGPNTLYVVWAAPNGLFQAYATGAALKPAGSLLRGLFVACPAGIMRP
jgi:hypothetical protein